MQMAWPGVFALLVATAATLRGMGRVWGEPRLWTSSANSPHTSQRLADPYTFTHVLHGLLFYALGGLGPLRGVSLETRLLLAVALEAAWEVSENTDRVIQRYRTATVSLGYTGDSVLNSMGDIAAMVGGFWIAHALPWWASALLFVGVELALLATIRDNLTLNVVQLIAPDERITRWQAAAPAQKAAQKAAAATA